MSDSEARTHSTSSVPNETAITVLGAGPAGALMSILLAQRGHRVVALERLPDLRRTSGVSGRSINLALADRGIHALKRAGVFATIEPLLVPMRGRMLHDEHGAQTFIPYGSAPHEVIYSVARGKLTGALLDCAQQTARVDVRFRQTCISVDATQRTLCMQDLPSGKLYSLPMHRTIGADGAGSVLRRFLVDHKKIKCSEDMLAHGYKELTMTAGENNRYRMEAHALHVWPRGDFMLIALPNNDGSFTLTLFLPHDGAQSFASLVTDNDVGNFFARHFPDVLALIPDLARQFFSHPTGSMGTVRCDQWSLDDALLLIGDAAHAIVPFHGQGMNCAFEDCVELDELLAESDWPAATLEFATRRIPNCNAIADMALENYIEMRDTVRDEKFQLRQALSHELEKRHPRRFIPRYSMVMFHHEIPYSVAHSRGRIQNEILLELTHDVTRLDAIDYARADALIEARLSPLATA